LKRSREEREKANLEQRDKKARGKTDELRQVEQERARRVLSTAPVDPSRLRSHISKPEFVRRGFYIDLRFTCKDCGIEEIWTATQQKWWYETAQGGLDAVAVRCRSCRRKERERKAAARKVHLDGLARKQRGVK
jgi:hypothetical protein